MGSGSFQERFNRRYLHLVHKYSQVIVGQFFGHHHSDSFRIIYNERGTGANNPGVRLYKFDTNTGQVLDYMQYYLDLSTANHLDSAEWRLEYNFTSFYGLTNISAASLHELAETFQASSTSEEGSPAQSPGSLSYNGNGQGSGSSAVSLPVVSHMLGADLFERYYRANSVGYHYGSRWGTCSATCRRGHYCSITKVDYAAFRDCMEVEVEEVVMGTGSFLQPPTLLTLVAAALLGRLRA
ncbi:hypothetical protein J437_LFUL011851 [Ladona fulva]|uniref:Sphingomyelin phosphodiesterase C-terminal domain-containing protein n=1 Tax=Ladona fulva TaxID=123851 RepID=A0A8K0K8P0_LADFU|nr:hypothetical protein J437_LFUL011851 [Ladona fulva]